MYNTNNPVEPNGSSDPRDLGDNAQVLDLLLNSDKNEVTGRTGKVLKGIAALQNVISSLDVGGFTFADTASGLAGTTSGQYFRVPQGENNQYAFIYYLNNSGAAEVVAKTLGDDFSKLMGEIQFSDLQEFSKGEYSFAHLSADKELIYGVLRENGYFECLGLKIGDTVITDGFIEELRESLAINYSLSSEYKKSGLVSALIASDFNLISGSDGKNTINTSGIKYMQSGYEKSEYSNAGLSSNFKELYGRKKTAIGRFTPYLKVSGSITSLFAYDTKKGVDIQITGTADGNASGLSITDNAVYFFLDGYTDVIGNQFTFNTETGEYHSRYTRKNKVVFWGHSFTASSAMPSRLRQLLGSAYSVYSFGRGGGKSSGIARRHGSIETKRTLPGGQIPASTDSFNLLPKFPGQHALADQLSTDKGTATILGVECQVEWNGSGKTTISDVWYHANRLTAGSAVTVPANTSVAINWKPLTTTQTLDLDNSSAVLIDVGVHLPQHYDCINILWVGRNSIPSQDQIMRDLTAMVRKIEASTENPKIVIMPEFPNSGETKGTKEWAQIYSLNRAYKSKFPEYYCEIDGVDALANFKTFYNPDLAQDVTDINNDITPSSLRADYLHPSQTLNTNAKAIGAYVNAEFIYKFLNKKGWL